MNADMYDDEGDVTLNRDLENDLHRDDEEDRPECVQCGELVNDVDEDGWCEDCFEAGIR